MGFLGVTFRRLFFLTKILQAKWGMEWEEELVSLSSPLTQSNPTCTFPGFQGILRKSPKLPFVSPYTLYPLPCNAHAQCPHALVMQGCYLVLILTRTKSSSCILILTVRPKYLSLLCSIYCWSLWRVHYVVGNFLKPKPKHCYLTWQLDHSPKYSELATFFFLKFLWLP